MSRGENIRLKTPEELDLMRVTCTMTARAHQRVREMAKPGVTTLEIDSAVEKLYREGGCIPAFQNVIAPGAPGPFGHTVCASVNDEVVHGLPTTRALEEGDILKADMGAIYKGWYSDAAITIPIGKVSDDAQRLIDVTRESLMRAIRLIRPGLRLRKICAEIQRYVEVENSMFVVKAYVGHGLGKSLWEPPQVPNYVPRGWQARELDVVLKPGLVLAIEPMVNLGTELVATADDGWTVKTQDGSLSAHFEHDVLVTDSGYEVLTLLDGDPDKFSNPASPS